mgnify:CR=1 FL=1
MARKHHSEPHEFMEMKRSSVGDVPDQERLGVEDARREEVGLARGSKPCGTMFSQPQRENVVPGNADFDREDAEGDSGEGHAKPDGSGIHSARGPAEMQASIRDLQAYNADLNKSNQELRKSLARSNALLRETESRLSLAQEFVGASTWEWVIETDEVIWSRNFGKMYGVSEENFEGTMQAWLEIIVPDDREAVEGCLRACLDRHDEQYRATYRISHPEKGIRWIDAMRHVVVDDGGSVVRITGFDIDITEGRTAEDAIRQNESRLAAIFAQADVGLSEIGTDGRFTLVNDRLCAMLERHRSELIGRSIMDVTYPEDRARNLPLFEKLLKTGQTFSIEKRYIRPDGSYFWAVSNVSRIVGRNNEVMGVIAATYDLSERRRVEERLRQAHDDAVTAHALAEKSSQAKSRFLAAVSHDLRQPVTSANLFLDQLRKRPMAPEERALVEPLANSFDSLTAMLNNLLHVARLDAGIVVPELIDFELDELLNHLAEDYGPVAAGSGIDLLIPQVSAFIRSDPGLLEMILRNLISNAIKYTRRGSVSVWTSIGSGSMTIGVSDTGLGIKPDQVDQIFADTYHDAEVARVHSRGFGIGLATAQRIACLLGSSIEVSSEVGRGSTFFLSLPLADTSSHCVSEVQDTEAQGHFTDDPAGCMALVVDDDPLVLQALEYILSSWGMDVHAVQTLEQITTLLPSLDKTLDIVVADYSLSHGEKGTDAVEIARFYGARSAMLLTGDTSPERLAEAERSGVRLLHKPISAEALESVVREACRRKLLSA